MSFARRDTHEAQVQFALERGVPAMIGVISSKRLPYPARAFDMAHCSRCLIPWYMYGRVCPADARHLLLYIGDCYMLMFCIHSAINIQQNKLINL